MTTTRRFRSAIVGWRDARGQRYASDIDHTPGGSMSDARRLSAGSSGDAGARREADDGSRTRDLELGKLALYQLSYVRVGETLSTEFYALYPLTGTLCPHGHTAKAAQRSRAGSPRPGSGSRDQARPRHDGALDPDFEGRARAGAARRRGLRERRSGRKKGSGVRAWRRRRHLRPRSRAAAERPRARLGPVSWPKGPWVADTSAWARADTKEVAPRWREVVKAGELIACPPVTMEMIFDAPNRDAVERIAVAMAGFRQAPINRSVTDAATWAMRELAQRGAAGAHRVRVPDALVAAAAAERGFGVLHYDRHFDTLASVLSFPSQWVAPAGSID